MKSKWLWLALPVVWIALKWRAKWRVQHPTPTKEDLKFRALMSKHLELAVVYYTHPDGFTNPNPLTLSRKEAQYLIKHFYFLPPSIGDPSGQNTNKERRTDVFGCVSIEVKVSVTEGLALREAIPWLRAISELEEWKPKCAQRPLLNQATSSDSILLSPHKGALPETETLIIGMEGEEPTKGFLSLPGSSQTGFRELHPITVERIRNHPRIGPELRARAEVVLKDAIQRQTGHSKGHGTLHSNHHDGISGSYRS